jgi:hypothetical protein
MGAGANGAGVTSASDELAGAKQSVRNHDVRLTGRRIVDAVTDCARIVDRPATIVDWEGSYLVTGHGAASGAALLGHRVQPLADLVRAVPELL